MLDKKQLENILLSKWAEFLNVRKLIQFAKESLIHYTNLSSSFQVFELRVSRFELTSTGFLIWLEVILTHSGDKINVTIEAFLSGQGELTYINNT